jgi:hypothetical protein
MYTVTATEVSKANRVCEPRHLAAGRWVPDKERTPESMPLMSFPWLFRRELGDIALRKSRFNTVRTPAPDTTRSIEPLPPATPSISTSPVGTEQVPDGQPPIEVEDIARKDSFELIALEPIEVTIAKSLQPGTAVHQSNGSAHPSALLDIQDLDFAAHDSKSLGSILSGSRAFGEGDKDELEDGSAELNSLPEEPSGVYESEQLDLLQADEGAAEIADGNDEVEVEVSGQ